MYMIINYLLLFKYILIKVYIMKIGYQCIKDCYSYNVIKKYLNSNIETAGYNNFEEIFDNLNNNKIDFAVLPIENSVDESTFVNYDL